MFRNNKIEDGYQKLKRQSSNMIFSRRNREKMAKNL